MLIEIFSDVVCPWCYIGKRRFEAALAEVADEIGDVTVVYRPFQLDPGAPSEPEPVLTAYAAKFGGEQQALSLMANVSRVAAGEGLEFHLDDAQRVNTLDAHRVLMWTLRTYGPSAQQVVKESLLRAYFTDGGNIADRAVLAAAVRDAGLDPAPLDAMLDGDDLRDDVAAELSDAHRRGVSAVPTYVFDDNWAISGAQDQALFAQALRTLSARAAT
ncbi:MAG: DsbA family oxidoreductase [Acidimicrobiia bacterium]